MKTLAAKIALALCLSSIAVTASASENATSFAEIKDAVLANYAPVAMAGFHGRAFVLNGNVDRSGATTTPGMMFFDAGNKLVAISFARPNADGVAVMTLADGEIHQWQVATVAAR